METPNLIPVMILRVNLACCKDCPPKLRNALLKKYGVFGVDFDSEYKYAKIRSTLDPIMLIKDIAKMNKLADLVFYDKIPMLEEQDRQHKNAKRSSEMKNPPTDGKEKSHDCPDFHDGRKERDDREMDNDCQGRDSRKSCGSSTNHRDPLKKKDDHEADDHRHARNARENAQGKYQHRPNNGECSENVRERGQGEFHNHRKVPDNDKENGSGEYYWCRNNDSHHKTSEGNNTSNHHDPLKNEDDHHHSRNGRENAPGTYHHCRNYNHSSERGQDHQKKFPHCRNLPDNASENGSKEYPRCRNYDPRYKRREEKKVPEMFIDEDADIFNDKEYTTGRSNEQSQCHSSSGRYDARNPEDWYDCPEAFPYEDRPSRMPPYHPLQMPPYYSDFSPENPNSCSIM